MGYIMRKKLKIFWGLRPRTPAAARSVRCRAPHSRARQRSALPREQSERETENGKFSVSEEILNFLDMGAFINSLESISYFQFYRPAPCSHTCACCAVRLPPSVAPLRTKNAPLNAPLRAPKLCPPERFLSFLRYV